MATLNLGRVMLIYCPGCRSLVAPDWRNCRYCGAPVDKAPSTREPPPVNAGLPPIYGAPPPMPKESAEKSQVSEALDRLTALVGRSPETARERMGRLSWLGKAPWLGAGGLLAASIGLTAVVCAATKTGDQSMFSAKDQYLAAYELLAPPTATPDATSLEPTVTPAVEETPSDATATESIATAPTESQGQAVPAQPSDDFGGDNGRGRGRGRGGD